MYRSVWMTATEYLSNNNCFHTFLLGIRRERWEVWRISSRVNQHPLSWENHIKPSHRANVPVSYKGEGGSWDSELLRNIIKVHLPPDYRILSDSALLPPRHEAVPLSLSKACFLHFSSMFYIFSWSQGMGTKHLLFIECLLGVRDCAKHFMWVAFPSFHNNPVQFVFSVFYGLEKPRSSKLVTWSASFHSRMAEKGLRHTGFNSKTRVLQLFCCVMTEDLEIWITIFFSFCIYF